MSLWRLWTLNSLMRLHSLNSNETLMGLYPAAESSRSALLKYCIAVFLSTISGYANLFVLVKRLGWDS
jgi:hypothetical protein